MPRQRTSLDSVLPKVCVALGWRVLASFDASFPDKARDFEPGSSRRELRFDNTSKWYFQELNCTTIPLEIHP